MALDVDNKYFFKGEKPVYYNECAAHANVFHTYGIRNAGVTMTGPVCDPEHKVEKLMAQWVPLLEFERDWKEVTREPPTTAVP